MKTTREEHLRWWKRKNEPVFTWYRRLPVINITVYMICGLPEGKPSIFYQSRKSGTCKQSLRIYYCKMQRRNSGSTNRNPWCRYENFSGKRRAFYHIAGFWRSCIMACKGIRGVISWFYQENYSLNLGFANSCMDATIAVSANALAYRLHIQLRGDYKHLPCKWLKSVAIVK